MYCPKCGDQMVEDGEIFTCVKGRSPTSIDLARRLREYEEKGRNAILSVSNRSFRFGGLWFCPCCATDLQEQELGFYCAGCGRSLDKWLFIFSSSSIPIGIKSKINGLSP